MCAIEHEHVDHSEVAIVGGDVERGLQKLIATQDLSRRSAELRLIGGHQSTGF